MGSQADSPGGPRPGLAAPHSTVAEDAEGVECWPADSRMAGPFVKLWSLHLLVNSWGCQDLESPHAQVRSRPFCDPATKGLTPGQRARFCDVPVITDLVYQPCGHRQGASPLPYRSSLCVSDSH